MIITKILCPVDFSEFNRIANRFASDLAARTGAEIIYLTVPEQGGGASYEIEMRRVKEREMQKLMHFKPLREGIKYSHAVEVSVLTARTIIEFAKENQIDLIVIGSHGRTGLGRALLGSVAEAVVRKSPCPVLVVKDGDTSFTTEEAVKNAASAGEEE